jgi:hypothetical protein
MKMFHVLAVVALLAAGAASAAAQGVTLEFQGSGKVRLVAQNVSVSQILAEWSSRGRTTIVNGERVPGPPVTLELQNVTEQEALDIVLRNVSGYLVAARETEISGASAFDRIYILPTSTRPTTAAPTSPAPQQALQVQDDSDDDEPQPNAPRGPNTPPGARLPREVNQPTNTVRPPVTVDDDRSEPENRPAPAPTNPFGVAPGTARPGVVTPGTPSPTTPGAMTPAVPAPNTPGVISPVPNRPNNQ